MKVTQCCLRLKWHVKWAINMFGNKYRTDEEEAKKINKKVNLIVWLHFWREWGELTTKNHQKLTDKTLSINCKRCEQRECFPWSASDNVYIVQQQSASKNIGNHILFPSNLLANTLKISQKWKIWHWSSLKFGSPEWILKSNWT